MDELERAVHQRNARFRAWASRVPIAGGWTFDGIWLDLEIRCLACNGRATWRANPVTAPDLESQEALAMWHEDRGDPLCPHFGELLCLEDPPEVQALTELELLAG